MQSAYELSSQPTRIQLVSSEYSEQEQKMFGPINKDLTVTWSGTQTFDGGGRPFDSDND